MKRITYSLFLMLAAILCFTACDSETLTFVPDGGGYIASDQVVKATFYGRLLDQNFSPVKNAEVVIGEAKATTDALGDWTIIDASVPGNQAYVKVVAEGYFAASRTVSVAPNTINLVGIMPVRRTLTKAFAANRPEEVVLDNGSSVVFAAESFVLADGTPYAGEVQVYAHGLDAAGDFTQYQMPGRLESATSNAYLTSYGMMAVELETTSGEQLQLADGMPATLSFAQADAAGEHEEIPLWYFDEELGTWVEESKAVKQGDRYVGEVSHFTWWNCDWPGSQVTVCFEFGCETADSFAGKAEDSEFTDAPFTVEVQVMRGTFSWGYTWLYEVGEEYCDLTTDNSTLTFTFRDSNSQIIQTFTYNIGTDDTDLGVIELDCQEIIDRQSDYHPYYSFPSAPAPPLRTNVTLNYTVAACTDISENIFILVSSDDTLSMPRLLQPGVGNNSTLINVVRTATIGITTIDASTSDTIGRVTYNVRPTIELGMVNGGRSIIGKPVRLFGTLEGCNSERLPRRKVEVLDANLNVLYTTVTQENGTFEINMEECDPRAVTLVASLPNGDRAFGGTIYDDTPFGLITDCQLDNNYFWKATYNGRTYSYSECNGRAGTTGWVAYASLEPDPSVPFFGLTNTSTISRTVEYGVGGIQAVKFEGFRVGNVSLTKNDYPFEGSILVTEYADVAAGVFKGKCIGPNGAEHNLEVEMRFVRP